MSKIKKFKIWEKEQKDSEEQEELMDDIVDEDELDIKKDTSEEDFNPKDWEIDSIIDVMGEDPTESEKEEDITEKAITFDATVPKDVSRGDTIWITALIKKKGNTSYNDPGKQAVIKLRVIDIYYGLQHLNKVINR